MVVGSGIGTFVSCGSGIVVGSGIGPVVGSGVGTVVGSGVGTVVGGGVGMVVGSGIGTFVSCGSGIVVGSGIGSVVGIGVGTAVDSGIGTVVGGNSTVVGSGIGAVVGSGVGTVFGNGDANNENASKPGEPLSVPMVDVHTGLPMTATLDILRHLWFRGPDSVASPHFVVWRHPDAIASTVKHLQKHVKTALIKITIYSAIASGRVRTSRSAIPDDKALAKFCHGNTGDKKIGGLTLAQFDVLRAYRDGWEWSPFMPEVEDSTKMPTTSRYRVPRPLRAASWEEPMWIVRVVYTSKERDMVTVEFIVGFEHPRGTTLYYDEVLWRIMVLAGLDPDEWFMKNQSNDFGGVMYKKSAEFALRSKGLRRHGAPLRDCGTLHDDEQGVDECSLYWPPAKLFNGRHQKTCMSSRDHKCKKPEQYHYVAPNVYHAAYVAEFHSLDQVTLTRGVVLDVCSGSQSATHAMDMMGVSAIPMDERTRVDTGWGVVHNEHLELNAGFAHDPGISAYDQIRDVCHARGVAMGRTNAVYVSIDCKPNIMQAQSQGLYRDSEGKPLPGTDGDLARECDDQLLDLFRFMKRMDDERKTLIEQRDRDDSELDADCDAPTDDEAERHETQQAAHCTGSTTEEALPSMLRLGTTLTEGLHVSTLGSASSPNLSSIDAVRATGDDEGGDMPVNDDGVDVVDDESTGTEMTGTTTLIDYTANAEVAGRHGTEPGSQRNEPTSAPDTAEQQNDMTSRVTGWCNGDSVRNDGSMTFVEADTLGQMPHGRWQSSIVLGMSSGISWDAASAGGTGRGWTARTFTDNNGTNIGMTRFRPTDMVNVGTGEELITKLTGMMTGTRVERRTSSSGVTSHLARSSRRIDMGPVLASVGLNVTNTNPMAHHMLQSFITNTMTVATTPTHRDENNAILIQLRGSKEVLVHPPTQSLPGCSAAIFASATLTDSRWLDVDPFKLSRAYSSKWVKVVMVPGDVVVMPKLWWHAVRSTPGSVAISVPVQLDEINERTSWHRTCRRDTQPVSARRGAGTSVSAEEPSDSRRADNSLGAGDPVAHFYALTDPQLAAACRIPYERVEGRVVSWNTGTGLATSAVSAATELGVSAQHTRDLIAWMASFQLRPTVGGAVLAAHTDERDEQGLLRVEPGNLACA